jgi:hypothetical protein
LSTTGELGRAAVQLEDQVLTYQVGVAHNLVGAGSVAIAQPVGLRLQLAGIPAASVNRRARIPVEYFGIGDLAVGNADGWGQRVPLRFAQQVVYPLPDSMSVLAYDLVAGLTVTATELTAPAVAVPTTEVWQRNPAAATFLSYFWNPAGQPSTNPYTYQVPPGRRLQLTSLRATLTRIGTVPAASINVAQAYWQLDGVGQLVTTFLSGGLMYSQDVLNGPLWLPALAAIRCFYYNSETAGGTYATLSFAGTLFDA